MKLNLGCGGEYKEGYINIDVFNSTVADELMSATALKFADNSIEIIEARQLIEHLGFVESIYALAEFFRVLEPKGILLIETPDIEASFKKYVEGDDEMRKNILPWIYGLETPGMQHKFCFPDVLLEKFLKKSGFVNIKKEFFEIDDYKPTLRISCKKPKEFLQFQVIAKFRKKLIKEKIVDMDDQLMVLEKEKLIDFFISKISQLSESEIVDEIVIKGAIHSPKMIHVFLQECVDKRLISNIENHIETLNFLIKINFPNLLFHLLKRSPDTAGEQNRIFQAICNLGKQSVGKLLHGEKSVIDSLSKMHEEIQGGISFFSERAVQIEADRLFQLGIKEFILYNYANAITKFEDSIKLDRNNVLNYWNLGRLLALKGNYEARKKYEKAIELVTKFDYKNKNQIKKLLEEEMNGPTKNKRPIASLDM